MADVTVGGGPGGLSLANAACSFNLICPASVPLSCDHVTEIFHQRNLIVDELVIKKTVDAVCSGSPA